MNTVEPASIDLTLDVCSEDGSRTQFYQNDRETVGKILRFLASPRLFSQPVLTLASDQSVSAIPTRSVDLILAHTPLPPAIILPPGWLDVVEVGSPLLPNLALLSEPAKEDEDNTPPPTDTFLFHAEIHTLGDWMVRLNLKAAPLPTVQEQRQFRSRFFEMPVIPFYLQAGGLGFINPQKITRITVYPASQDMVDAALPAGLLRCIRR